MLLLFKKGCNAKLWDAHVEYLNLNILRLLSKQDAHKDDKVSES